MMMKMTIFQRKLNYKKTDIKYQRKFLNLVKREHLFNSVTLVKVLVVPVMIKNTQIC